MNLVIVESPTKARTLAKFLGKDFIIEATMGHVRDLPAKKLGIEITPGGIGSRSDKEKIFYSFKPDYEIIADRKKRINELKEIASKASQIILATDPDREGEAIAYHIKFILGKAIKIKKDEKFSRIVFHEITKGAITQALEKPRLIDLQLVDAQQTRRILDRLVGYKLSPLLWNKMGKRWLSAGRVQSVAVRLIVEREREIQAFKPTEYWQIDVELQKSEFRNQNSVKTDTFISRLYEINANKAEIGNREVADKAKSELEKSKYQVRSVETKEVRRSPYPPYTTSTLQQAASNKYGWSAKRTMRAAQKLYEEGYITYHRTDSTNLAVESVKMARDFISKIFGENFIPASPKVYKTKSKVAQEAHEAVRPTHARTLASYDMKNVNNVLVGEYDLKILPTELGRDQELLYSLIWKRFIACQMNDALFDQKSIIIDGLYSEGSNSSVYGLRTSGQIVKFAGWLSVFDKKEDRENLDNGVEDEKKELPDVKENEDLNYINIFPMQKFTEPPPRFNEASLIKALEEKGIGRPSTYAPIISTIQDRRYVEKLEKKFHPTDLGISVNDFLVKYFPDVFDATFTASMEDELDEIANGKLKSDQVLNDFYSPFKKKLDLAFATSEKVKLDLGTTNEKCPDCGNNLVIRISKFGKFLACSNFPKCKYTKNILEKAGIECPKCKGDIIVKKTRHGKQFYGCSNYPKCTFAAWKKEDIK